MIAPPRSARTRGPRPSTRWPWTTSTGRPLRGRNRYAIRFPRGELPPANAFWSVTLYGQDRYLVPNQIDRYAIGDRSKGLRRGRDGSLTIYVQHARSRARRGPTGCPPPSRPLPLRGASMSRGAASDGR